ncbi:MAG: hypothetical protein SPLUMA1_SPLUMAMAG1_01542 [uncultured Sulfurimonas sp.]|nr:MAG: hypothetical protein SPLUMA1_SPLUMAMAG1_01542 [uncultured Sulfurimonas sp.]
MIQKGLVSALLRLVLVFSGCGSSDNEGESRLATQQMLDDGDYTGVIEKLEPTATTDEEYLALASAYMGKAGYSLLEIISAITSDDDLVFSLASSSSFSSTLDFNKAVENFKNVVG